MLNSAAAGHAAAPLVLLLLALIADGLLGGLPGLGAALGAPQGFVRGLTRWFDGRLNRRRRGVGAVRIRGLLVVVVLVGLAWAAGAAVVHFAGKLPYGWIIEAVAVLTLLGQHRTIARARVVARGIAAGKPDDARKNVDPMVRYDAAALDEFGIARATIEGTVVRFTENYIGCVFWYLLLGLPALFVYRAVTAAADVIGRRSARHGDFGFAAARLGDVLSLLPAILAGPILAIAAIFIPGARPVAALAGWARDLARRGIRGAFRAEGAMAGALDIALGGPRPYDGETVPGSWVGDGRARTTATDIRRAVMLVVVACLLVTVLVALALVAPAHLTALR